jgi:hypothetical protein
VANIPVFTAAGGKSSATAASWRSTISTGIACTPETPRVFCAVMATTTLVPNTPNW